MHIYIHTHYVLKRKCAHTQLSTIGGYEKMQGYTPVQKLLYSFGGGGGDTTVGTPSGEITSK